jgi:hypothetical protein
VDRRKRRRPRLALWLAVASCASAPAGAEPVRPAGEPAAQRASLWIEAPAEAARLRRPDAQVEVRGRVRAELYDADLVLALDVSNSSLLASGGDLDGDGEVGATRAFAEDAGRFATSHARWTSDAGDSMLRAELVAAHALIDALAARRNHIGLLTYTSRVRVRAPVGAPEAARRALDAVPIAEDRSGTDVSRALRHAALLLSTREAVERPRAVLLCSDGEPTVPQPRYEARQKALREARQLAESGIALYVLAFGAHLGEERGEDDLAFLRALADAGRGVLVEVDSPARLLEDLPPAAAAPDVLEVLNVTSGEPARSLHVTPDGRFDARLPLVPGVNALRVRAVWNDGRSESAWRSVRYEAEGRE